MPNKQELQNIWLPALNQTALWCVCKQDVVLLQGFLLPFQPRFPSFCSSHTSAVYASTAFCLQSSNLLSEHARSLNNLFHWLILDIRNLFQIDLGRYDFWSSREAAGDSPESENETEAETWLKCSEPSSSLVMAEDMEPIPVLQQAFRAQTLLWERAWGCVTSSVAFAL